MRLPFDGIAARIALVAIVGLVAAQLVSVGLAILLRPTEFRLYAAPWLLETTVDAARATFALPPARRDAALRARPEAEHLDFDWTPSLDPAPEPRPSRGRAARLERAIAERLGPGYAVIGELAIPGFGFPPAQGRFARHGNFVRVPADDGAWADAQTTIPGIFRISVRGPDGTYLIVRPRTPGLTWGWVVLGAWLAGIAVAAAAAALWAARRVARPLETVAAAAQRAGAGLSPDLPGLSAAPREVRTIGDSLARMRAQLVRHVEDRTRMLAAVSHDLRTPLTRLRLRAETIPDPEERAKAQGDIVEMEKMIAETLAFARADAMQSPPERFDLAALVQTLIDERVDLGREASYEGPTSFVVEGRAGAIKRALANLIDNALAYGERAGVTLRALDDRIDVAVADEGPGIPPDQMEQVFRPFYRIEASRSRETGGAGLGLSVARDVAIAHGGEVRLANRPVRGLEATFVLPRVG
ncbi:MAG: sensor histidine kinase [Tagaea sp.]